MLAGQMVCTAAVAGIYALLGKLDAAVLLGSLVGTVLATLNFFFMALTAMMAADKAAHQDVRAGQTIVKGSYFFRLGMLFLLLFVFAASGLCNVIALVLPLVFVRPILTLTAFFRKPGDTGL